MCSKSLIAVAICISSCAHLQPASMPASQPWFTSLDSGQPAPEDGFFLGLLEAKAWLKYQATHDLDLQEKLEHEHMLRVGDEKQLASDAWWKSWGIPLSVSGGLALGVLIGILGTSVSHR